MHEALNRTQTTEPRRHQKSYCSLNQKIKNSNYVRRRKILDKKKIIRWRWVDFSKI